MSMALIVSKAEAQRLINQRPDTRMPVSIHALTENCKKKTPEEHFSEQNSSQSPLDSCPHHSFPAKTHRSAASTIFHTGSLLCHSSMDHRSTCHKQQFPECEREAVALTRISRSDRSHHSVIMRPIRPPASSDQQDAEASVRKKFLLHSLNREKEL